MPELPEVETTRRGIAPHIEGKRLSQWLVREPRLRWPIEPQWPNLVAGQTVYRVTRRSKYLVLHLDQGQILAHLGMSGQFRIVPTGAALEKHDHCDWIMEDGTLIRYRDPRRFGAILYTPDWTTHPLITKLGPEPLSDDFTSEYLYSQLRKRRGPIKTALMDASLVVGVGNIYANEALFEAGIHPTRACDRISLARCESLTAHIKTVLARAIDQGGTTLRDYVSATGQAGYFRIELKVYGRKGEPCVTCAEPLREIRMAGRSTVYCVSCQR
ncbi:bifunctional DNA-formamidopyrimidine glycosylase/DNA-(apurinic or apyrimidinic site) lyase [Salinispirillum sp. LH 10-3-1]|uniref:Formamidopyrimidine-DNA glycosylase n=1 Tax=Salinispirillum sp. LH 10-3-1 TaxID=2952525 RepID=A0AB38YGI0_9GAMM